ncbi:MAG: hypothetical protein ABI697_04505 [Devosia sp.]
MDLIIEKATGVQSLLFRTIEYLGNQPLRRRGVPSVEVRDNYRPWLFQSPPGSYQFAVSIERPAQAELFGLSHFGPAQITETFLEIVRASAESPSEQLPKIVRDEGYRSVFLKMVRNLSPNGKSADQIELSGSNVEQPVVLFQHSRDIIKASTDLATKLQGSQTQETLRGILRAVHLDKDWLDITIDDNPYHVTGVSEVVDDVIGPMVNHEVLIRVSRKGKGRLLFVDIELAD